MEHPYVIEQTIGPDTIHLIGDDVTIFAAREMPDWTVRQFCICPIHFQGKKFYLKRRLDGPAPFAFRYELSPWTTELGVESSRAITYDEDYVAERERDSRTFRRQDRAHDLLLPVYPLLGLCWSGYKERVLGPMGFEPIAVTAASIMVCFACFLLEAIFVLYFHLGFLGLVFSSSSLLNVDWLLFLLLPIDCVIRYGRVLRGDESPAGFLEWIFRRNPSAGRWG